MIPLSQNLHLKAITILVLALTFGGCGHTEGPSPRGEVDPRVLETTAADTLLSVPTPTASYQQQFLALAKNEGERVSFAPGSYDFPSPSVYGSLFEAYYDGKVVRGTVDAKSGFVRIGNSRKEFKIIWEQPSTTLLHLIDDKAKKEVLGVGLVHFGELEVRGLTSDVTVEVERALDECGQSCSTARELIHHIERAFLDRGKRLYFVYDAPSKVLKLSMSAESYSLSPWAAGVVSQKLDKLGIPYIMVDHYRLIVNASLDDWLAASEIIENTSLYGDQQYLVHNGMDIISVPGKYNPASPVNIEMVGWTKGGKRVYNLYLGTEKYKMLQVTTDERILTIKHGYPYKIRLF